MRPRGEIRAALSSAAVQLHQERGGGGGTWRELAARAQVGFNTARATVKNMVVAGELEPVDQVVVAHSRRPMVRYKPRQAANDWSMHADGLSSVVRAWKL